MYNVILIQMSSVPPAALARSLNRPAHAAASYFFPDHTEGGMQGVVRVHGARTMSWASRAGALPLASCGRAGHTTMSSGRGLPRASPTGLQGCAHLEPGYELRPRRLLQRRQRAARRLLHVLIVVQHPRQQTLQGPGFRSLVGSVTGQRAGRRSLPHESAAMATLTNEVTHLLACPQAAAPGAGSHCGMGASNYPNQDGKAPHSGTTTA